MPSLSLTHISSLHTAHRACTRAHAASTGPIGRLQPDWFESAHCIARHRAKPMARPRPLVLYVVVRCVLYVIACCCVLYIVCCRLWSLAIPTARREAAMHGRFRPQLCLHVVRRMLLPWCAAYAPAVDRLALARCARFSKGFDVVRRVCADAGGPDRAHSMQPSSAVVSRGVPIGPQRPGRSGQFRRSFTQKPLSVRCETSPSQWPAAQVLVQQQVVDRLQRHHHPPWHGWMRVVHRALDTQV